MGVGWGCTGGGGGGEEVHRGWGRGGVRRCTGGGVPNLSRQRSGTALKLLWQLLANVLFAGTYGYWQQMKTSEDLKGLKFS